MFWSEVRKQDRCFHFNVDGVVVRNKLEHVHWRKYNKCFKCFDFQLIKHNFLILYTEIKHLNPHNCFTVFVLLSHFKHTTAKHKGGSVGHELLHCGFFVLTF